MANKTANVLARVEPEVKEKAESIMNQLGIPASVVINMLYRQIIMTNSIPFSLSVPAPVSRDEMDNVTFNKIMETGLRQAQNDDSTPATEVFEQLKQEVKSC